MADTGEQRVKASHIRFARNDTVPGRIQEQCQFAKSTAQYGIFGKGRQLLGNCLHDPGFLAPDNFSLRDEPCVVVEQTAPFSAQLGQSCRVHPDQVRVYILDEV